MQRSGIHHLELWLADLAEVERSWGWLLGQLGFVLVDSWPTGQSWQQGQTYLVLEAGPDVRAAAHDRMRPGLNHVAFWAGSRAEVDRLSEEAGEHGWRLLFEDEHPHAGGPDSYAAYLENESGFEVELVAAHPTDLASRGAPPV